MKAMIFAAGLGTRLRPLTNDRPKALVEVAGKPMLEHVIVKLINAGIDDITINIHHFGQKIIDFINSKNNFGININISDERDMLLDTGGGILKAREFLDGDEPILVHNADILTNVDLTAMLQNHQETGAIATILVKSRETQRYFLFDERYKLHGWINKKTGETIPASLINPTEFRPLAFGGVHILSPAIFDCLEQYAKEERVFSITPFYINQCESCLIHGFEQKTPYDWYDIGKPETLAIAEKKLKLQ